MGPAGNSVSCKPVGPCKHLVHDFSECDMAGEFIKYNVKTQFPEMITSDILFYAF